jgi:porin
VALLFAPQQRRNPMPFFVMGGLVYQGLVMGRDNDVTTFGVAYGKFSNELPNQGFELVLEWSHAFALTPCLTVQPDVQYVIHPGGDRDVSNALVLGVQLALKF